MYATKPARPAIDNEAHYENRYDNGKVAYPYWNASDVRIGSWQAVRPFLIFRGETRADDARPSPAPRESPTTQIT